MPNRIILKRRDLIFITKREFDFVSLNEDPDIEEYFTNIFIF